jgi:hypothetical protein
MKRPQNCVKCGATLTTKEILAAGPFPCPTCHTQLQAAESYGVWVGYGSALATFHRKYKASQQVFMRFRLVVRC